ncbi:LLM class flavin-dependent oxidoreductase [Streptomyces mirabilis]|uniref:LLM class flavin-dependent oxidoreductase n=1 Tax=Streptomyces mirabilis TaxID=68239 RepID=UPI0036B48951
MTPQEASGTIGVLLPRDIPHADIICFAQEADAYGFDELWVVEDLGYRGGLVQAAAVPACTRRIRVGVGFLPAAARNVAFAAMEVATLAQLHPGRLTVAIGHGMPDWMRGVGAWPASPLTLLGEYIHTLKTLLAGRLADTDGRYIQLDGLRLEPSVLPEQIFAGVRGPKSLALAGEVADGTLLAEPVTPEYVRQALTSINSQRPHQLAAYNITVVDDDPHAALRAARTTLQPLGDPDWAPEWKSRLVRQREERTRPVLQHGFDRMDPHAGPRVVDVRSGHDPRDRLGTYGRFRGGDQRIGHGEGEDRPPMKVRCSWQRRLAGLVMAEHHPGPIPSFDTLGWSRTNTGVGQETQGANPCSGDSRLRALLTDLTAYPGLRPVAPIAQRPLRTATEGNPRRSARQA